MIDADASAAVDSSIDARRFDRGSLGVCLVFLLQLVAGASLAIHRLFSRFRFYDDEGTLMLWDRHLANGYALYDEIWNIYGPFPYLLRYVVHEFTGAALSHDAYRIATAVLWLLSASLLSAARLLESTLHLHPHRRAGSSARLPRKPRLPSDGAAFGGRAGSSA